MVLGYGARESTRDVDAMALVPCERSIWSRAVASVGASLDLPDDWINDGAKGYVRNIELGEVLMVLPSLRVTSASASQLLAMKLSAWRDDVDISDARLLLAGLKSDKSTTWVEVARHVTPGRELTASLAFEDLWESLHGHS